MAIFTLTLNPALDKELAVPRIALDQVLRAWQTRLDLGGKGFNVSRMLLALGVPSTAVAFAGGHVGRLLRDGLHALGIAADFVWLEGETRTNVSVVERAPGAAQGEPAGHYLKANEPGPPVSEAELAALLARVAALAAAGDCWVLSGSLPPGVPAHFYAEIIRLLHEAGARVVVDTSGEPLRLACAAGPFLVKPNEAETAELTGLAPGDEAQALAAATAVRDLGPRAALVSRGKAGALLAAPEGAWRAGSPAIVEANPIGAGDSMLAGAVCALEAGLGWAEALRWGVACGSATAAQPGTAVGSRAQVEELLPRVAVSGVQ